MHAPPSRADANPQERKRENNDIVCRFGSRESGAKTDRMNENVGWLDRQTTHNRHTNKQTLPFHFLGRTSFPVAADSTSVCVCVWGGGGSHRVRASERDRVGQSGTAWMSWVRHDREFGFICASSFCLYGSHTTHRERELGPRLSLFSFSFRTVVRFILAHAHTHRHFNHFNHFIHSPFNHSLLPLPQSHPLLTSFSPFTLSTHSQSTSRPSKSMFQWIHTATISIHHHPPPLLR